ncbi:phosphoribosyltransferase [Nocardioides yefusunii]|uniref:Phosphoribosyltransferase n=1 Tax=Nocardioides yefusunii TaxID=2500546 RepID=A0ABW1QZV1_9ACTN|nr:phosphoribosyltransferase [Nocardioides yefusunii]
MSSAALSPIARWVADRLDITVTEAEPVDGHRFTDLFGFALRRNPKRAHLLVSTVLGKHLPAAPEAVLGSGHTLGERVRDLLGEATSGAVVLGFAETATSLGHCVADSLDATYLHTTRRDVPVPSSVGAFEEGHSHATTHLVLPEDPSLLHGTGPLVLVDDELSTGSTAINFITQLHAYRPRETYVIASLVDVRTAADRARLASFAASLGARVEVVALAAGEVEVADGVLERGQELVAEHAGAAGIPITTPAVPAEGRVVRITAPWPGGVPDGGRHGFTPQHRARLDAALGDVVAPVVSALTEAGVGAGAPVHVLGHEELMYVPLRVADTLAVTTGVHATFSSTTRSPVLPVDDDGYAIRNALVFPSHDDPSDGAGVRFAYNLLGAGASQRFDAVVLVVDDVADTDALHAEGGLVAQLRQVTPVVVVLTVPSWRPGPEPLRGPTFGSYAPDDVAWLLTDLSHAALEAPTEEREEAVQRGGAHYSESLPVEYQPSAQYREAYAKALDLGAARVAAAVGTLAELVLRERAGRVPVLVSLARAGTPVGILLRRWYGRFHDVAPAHHAVSIVRGRGIDVEALRWIAHHHDPADVVFVDGWTGKGAIARELTAALEVANAELGTAFGADLAVLADPGHCTRLFGTRDDFLIPSACLNSTVSGLVSRTVLNRDLIGPGQFHGAKFYADLAAQDVSEEFLTTVESWFDDVRDQAVAQAAALHATDRTPTWAGWAAVEEIAQEWSIGSVNLVKPGVGETTRVLLRRVPWKVLVSPTAGDDLAHVRALAAERGVEVLPVEGLPYACVGLIHPLHTPGATGADGRAVQPS